MWRKFGLFFEICLYGCGSEAPELRLFSGLNECGLFLKRYAVLGDIFALFGLIRIFCNRFQSL